MSSEIKHGHGPVHDDYEHQDLDLRPVFVALAALAVICLLVAAIVVGVYRYMDSQVKAEQPPQNPLVTASVPDPRTATKLQFTEEIKSGFPQPRLEEDERGQLNSIRMGQDQVLASYGVDDKGAVVRIPITRAMELITQRGLPVLARGAAPVAEKAVPPVKERKAK